jgi:hypothetical protein
MFVIKNMHLFQLNSNIHGINTRIKRDLHLPSTNLTLVQKGVLYAGSKMYNQLPVHIKNLSNNIKNFKSALKNNLIDNAFYSLDEYYCLTWYDCGTYKPHINTYTWLYPLHCMIHV